MTDLVVPCHWDVEVLKQLEQQNKRYSNGIQITDMYGAIPGEAIGNGRSPNKVSRLSRQSAKKFREKVREAGIRFNYLLNNSIPFANNPRQEEVKEYLDWVVQDLRPDALVIASLDLMRVVREIYGEIIPLHVSTIAGVSSPRDLERFIEVHPEKVVLQNDAVRNFDQLLKMVNYTSAIGIGLEIMATESCLRNCNMMDLHRDHISQGGDDTKIQHDCNCVKLTLPSEFLRANFIRPEDVEFYEKLGVRSFKITGRSKPAQWLPAVTEAYLKRSFDGNLVRLLGIDPRLRAEEWIHIDNSSLNGFIQNFPSSGRKEEEEYCNLWARRLMQEGKMRIDGFEYDLTGGCPRYLRGLEKFRSKYYPGVK